MIEIDAIKLFLIKNYDELKIGKLYCHSKEFIEYWTGFQLRGRFYYYNKQRNDPGIPFNFDNNFIILCKEKINPQEGIIKYTILHKELILYRVFYYENRFVKNPILNLVY